MRIEQESLAVFRRCGEGARELVERAIVELRRDFDEPGHTAESLPSRWSRRPVAPRWLTLRAPMRGPSRRASSRLAPATRDATPVAPATSPPPVGPPSGRGVPSAGVNAVRNAPPV